MLQLSALITSPEHSSLRCYCSIFLNYKIFIFLLTFCKAYIPFPHSNTCMCLFHYRNRPARYQCVLLGRSQLMNQNSLEMPSAQLAPGRVFCLAGGLLHLFVPKLSPDKGYLIWLSLLISSTERGSPHFPAVPSAPRPCHAAQHCSPSTRRTQHPTPMNLLLGCPVALSVFFLDWRNTCRPQRSR